MAYNKTKNERATSPKGIAQYPHVQTPDTKFDADGKYTLNLRLAGDVAESFVAMLEEKHTTYYDEFCEREGTALKKGNLPLKEVESSTDGEIDIKFGLKAVGRKGDHTWEQRPLIFDSAMNPITGDKLDKMRIGSGTSCRVGYEIVPYHTGMVGMGLSLRLKAVQIIDLVEYDLAGSGFAFEAEAGFVSDDTVEITTEF
jgi:hypothetical protein